MSKKLVLASKKLNKQCTLIENDLFKAEVMWCRSAYDGYERWPLKFHRHSFIELHVMLSGSIIYSFEESDKDINVKQGEFLFIPVNVSHRLKDVERGTAVFKLAFNIIEPKSLNNDISDNIGEKFLGKTDSYMTGSIDYLHYLACLDAYGYKAVLKSQLSAFGAYVLQKIMRDYEFCRIDDETYDNDDRVHFIKKIIEDNISSKLMVDDIASQLNVSRRQLNRIVKASEELSVSELILKMRIAKAKKLLVNTRTPVEIIAEMTGFLNGSHFSRVFRTQEGTTPTQYRKDIVNTYRKDN